MEAFQKVRDYYEVEGRRVARGVAARLLRRTHISPNAVTVTGTLLNGVAAVLVFGEQFLAAAIVFLLGSLLDAMDGAIAKVTGRVSDFGGFLDSTLDRVSEGLVLGGLGLMFSQQGNLWALAACFVALASSYLVSYTRAKAESLGVTNTKGGLASRVERVVILAIGLALAAVWPKAIEVTAYILAVTTALTVVQRVANTHKALPDHSRPQRKDRSLPSDPTSHD